MSGLRSKSVFKRKGYKGPLVYVGAVKGSTGLCGCCMY